MGRLACHYINTIVEATNVTCGVFCQYRGLTGSYVGFQGASAAV